MATTRSPILQHRRTDSWPLKKQNERVAVLDITNNKLRTLDKEEAERKFSSYQNYHLKSAFADLALSTEVPHEKVALPRWANKKSVYVSIGKGKDREYIATVHLRRLGFQYNIYRHFGMSEDLYVLSYQ
jgi:hypothetical protein